MYRPDAVGQGMPTPDNPTIRYFRDHELDVETSVVAEVFELMSWRQFQIYPFKSKDRIYQLITEKDPTIATLDRSGRENYRALIDAAKQRAAERMQSGKVPKQ